MNADVDSSPARLSSVLGVFFGAVALITIVIAGTTLGLFLGLFGLVATITGVWHGERNILTLGGLGLLTGVVIAGLFGAQPILVLSGIIAVALTWDVSENSITTGERLGQAAETQQIEIVHIAATTTITTLSAGSAYLVYQLSIESNSPVALVALLLAGVILTAGLRN